MTFLDLFVSPFTDYAFMRRALAAAVILALGGTPLGVFMMLRRMTLVGDALSHAILPGVAIGFLVAGLSVWAMSLGGLIAAIIVALVAVFLVRTTQLKEDAAFTLLYLLSLGGGVTLLSMRSTGVNLLHLLFGNILAIDTQTLMLAAGVSIFSLYVLCLLYRRLVIDGFDPSFLAVTGGGRGAGWTSPLFFVLLMINLVAAFQALGTLMALGLMILPALAARFWVRNIDTILPLAMFLAIVSAYAGLLFSYYFDAPSGPAIVLVAGMGTLVSAFIGRVGSVRLYLRNGR